MTAMVVLDTYNLSATASVSAMADSQYPVLTDVKLSDTASVENFLNVMLVASSNKSAYVLAEILGEETFVAKMNQKAKDIGLSDTFFADATGLSEKNYSTAEDLAKLAEYVLKNYPKISQITRISQLDIPGIGTFQNTDELLNQTQDVLISKTGFTNDAKGCLLLVVNNPKNSDYLIYIILGASDRFLAMKNLMIWTKAAYTW